MWFFDQVLEATDILSEVNSEIEGFVSKIGEALGSFVGFAKDKV